MTIRTITKLIDYEEFCGIRGEAATFPDLVVADITPTELGRNGWIAATTFTFSNARAARISDGNIGGHLIPSKANPARGAAEADSSKEIVAHCRSGKRSAEAVDFLRKAGFRKISNLKGGILAWSDEVDPSVLKITSHNQASAVPGSASNLKQDRRTTWLPQKLSFAMMVLCASRVILDSTS